MTARRDDDWTGCPDGRLECACGGGIKPGVHSPQGCRPYRPPGHPTRVPGVVATHDVRVSLTDAELATITDAIRASGSNSTVAGYMRDAALLAASDGSAMS